MMWLLAVQNTNWIRQKSVAHILQGLIIASDNIDEVIAIIRASATPDEARERLMKRFELSDLQARAIVEMRLRQLTGLEQDKLRQEYDDIMKMIDHYKNILSDLSLRMEIIKERTAGNKRKIWRFQKIGSGA